MVRLVLPNLIIRFLIVTRLLNYTPPAVVIRLLTTNGLITYITSWVLYLSGASSDPRLLLPAWISITTVRLTFSIQFNPLESPSKLTLPIQDPHIPLPCDPEPRRHQTRNSSLRPRRLRRQLSQHVLSAPTAASNPRERTRGPCVRHLAEIMGLGCCHLSAHEGCRW